jgi:hypothetical protein
MATLGWPGWRSIWAPPKGGKAAAVPGSSYSPQPLRNHLNLEKDSVARPPNKSTAFIPDNPKPPGDHTYYST